MTTQHRVDIAQGLAAVRERVAAACHRAGRSPVSVRIIGASKTIDSGRLIEAVEAGIDALGENRVQEAEPKIRALRERGVRVEWRMIGHLQSNKVRRTLELFDTIDTVDSISLARAIDQRASRQVPVLLEVNLGEEPSKTGILPGELPALVDAATSLPRLDVRGLMTIAPLVDNPESVRPVFARLRDLAARWGFPELSMGMTDDFEVAVEEGSTMIRVGRAIFGARPEAH